MKFNKNIFLALLLLYGQISVAQNITWANKLLELSDRFQLDNNGTELILGVPSVYPNKFDEKVDTYAEGYIMYNENTLKKNIFKVGFPSPITAKQVVIGGIFNIGSIHSISIFTADGKESEIYHPAQKASKVKFTTFSAFFPSADVVAVKITIDHSKINEWNIVRGVGLSTSEQPIDLKPAQIPQANSMGGKEKVGGNVSSKDCYDFSPKLSPDGRTLYFVKECPNQSDQEIWMSELNDKGEWSEAKNAGYPLNNKGHNFVASVSIDGRFIILGNTYNDDGSDAGDGVSISHKNEDGTWETPRSIKIPEFKNLNKNANFYMSSNETVLLMAIQDEKSNGDLDLYASFFNKSNQTWSSPANLGNVINTPFAEDYPYLAIDGKTLYFSSKGYLGYGGHDIYMSKRLDDTWRNWSKPLNLGPLVNSKTDDKGFAIAARGDQAYFNTVNYDVDSAHHMDIYKVNLPKILKQNPHVLMSGKLLSKDNNSAVRGTVRVKNNDGEMVAFCTSNPKNGRYLLSVPFGKVYNMRIDAINYFMLEEKLNFTDSLIGIELTKNYNLSSFLDSGQYITINNVLFETKSSQLTTSNAMLDDLAQKLVQQPDAIVEIGGHTDNLGDPLTNSTKKPVKKGKAKAKKTTLPVNNNKTLSLERAKSVGKYLVSKGVSENRLRYKGYGSEKPIADNKTEEGRAKNRRVVITYLSKLPKQ